MVLIPVDGSSQSLDAVRAVVREGADAIERVDLVNVQPKLNSHIARWVPKRERDGRTVTEVTRLAPEDRVLELAAMLGGPTGGAAAAASARELLQRAVTWAAERRAGRP